jgi:hypothetical protein
MRGLVFQYLIGKALCHARNATCPAFLLGAYARHWLSSSPFVEHCTDGGLVSSFLHNPPPTPPSFSRTQCGLFSTRRTERRGVKAEEDVGHVTATDDGDAQAASVLLAMGTPTKAW